MLEYTWPKRSSGVEATASSFVLIARSRSSIDSVILDGLDEGDVVKMDRLEKRPEIEVLIECLGNLKSTRILFISRPEISIHELIPELPMAPISDKDNRVDIETYVRKKFSDSNALRTWYPNNSSDPIKDFVSHSNGLFLWVFVVLNQLSRATDESIFHQYLNKIWEASGDMDQLYFKTFSQIQQKDHKWVNEVLRWVMVARRDLGLDELMAAVQWCLNDKKLDFKMFLEMQCGSIVRMVSGSEGSPTVQLLHETLRSFILDRRKCPPELWIDEERAHGYVALKCLQCLSTEDDSNVLIKYGARQWVGHLLNATSSEEQCFEILVSLHRLFMSKGVRVWIRSGLSKVQRPYSSGLDVIVEESYLQDIKEWLIKSQRWYYKSIEMERLKSDGKEMELEKSYMWSHEILWDERRLGEYVGKAAANVWFYDDIGSFSEIETTFLLALKYYWRREGRILSNVDELRELSSTTFNGIVTWMGGYGQGQGSPKQKNLGVAFAALRQWNESISCYRLSVYTNDDDPETWEYLGDAYERNGDYGGAIKSYEKAIEKNPGGRVRWHILKRVATAYEAIGNFDGVITLYSGVVEREPTRQEPWRNLVSAYKAKEDYDGLIKVCERMLEKNTNDWYEIGSVGWGGLADAYKAKNDYDGLFKAYARSTEKDPNNCVPWVGLAEEFMTNGQYDRAIQAYRTAIEKSPNAWNSWMRIGDAYKAKGDYDSAIEVYEWMAGWSGFDFFMSRRFDDLFNANGDSDGAIKVYRRLLAKYPKNKILLEQLIDAYKAKGDSDGAINAYKEMIEKDPNDVHLWHDLAEEYRRKGDYDEAIQVYGIAMTKNPDVWLWHGLGDSYKAKGDNDGAIKAYENAIEAYENGIATGRLHRTGIYVDLLRNALAEAYKAKEDFGGLMRLYRATLNEDVWHWKTWDHLADLYNASGDYDGLIKEYKKALELNPTISELWSRLGHAYKTKGEYNEAIRSYEMAAKMNPAKMHDEVLTKRNAISGDDHPSTLTSMHNLAETHRQQGKLTETAKMKEEMLTITKGSTNHDDLPAGWGKRYTDDGRPYYVDHNTRKTSWAMPFAARAL